MLPKSLVDAIEALSDLPGIGARSAERLVFSLLRNESGLDVKIARALGGIRERVKECEVCFHFCEGGGRCVICENSGREVRQLCIVESPVDLVALERTHEFRGIYHVLHGVISPLNKVGVSDLRIEPLFERVKKLSDLEEIILAMPGNTEGEATAFFLQEKFEGFFGGKVTRLARGIPSGGDLDYLDNGTLSRAILDRG